MHSFFFTYISNSHSHSHFYIRGHLLLLLSPDNLFTFLPFYFFTFLLFYHYCPDKIRNM